jgi:phenylacetate-CoA ligase
VARNFRREWLRAITSGGTTGTPTRFWADARSYDAVFAAWRHAMWRRVGHAPGSRCLDITWAFVRDKPLRASGEPGRVYLSINALDADQLELWWRDVAALRPQFIIGYPSTATALAKLLPRAGALAEVRALILASETLSRHQEGVLRTSFPTARIFQWYGMSEMAGFASGCEQADAFHHWPQSGILEVIGEDGRPVERPGDVGEIVLTGFANWATPFLRYRTGDRATLGPPCPHCGGARPVLARIEGRLDDYLLGARGRVVPLSALNYHGEEFRRVFAHQFIQEAPGQVLLRVVASPGFASQDLAAIRRLMEEKLGPDLMLTIEQAASIPRTARGKQPLIVQRCPRPRGGVEPRPDVCRP